MTTMQVKILSDWLRKFVPTRMTEGAAGHDVRAAIDMFVDIPSLGHMPVPCGIAIEVPHGYEVQLRGRSGFAARGVLAHVGTLDSDYRGEVHIILYNLSPESFRINPGDRIGQLVMNKIEVPDIQVVDELTPSVRDDDGCGSTGVA